MPNVQVAIRCRPKLDHESGIPSTKLEINESNNTIAVLSQSNAKTFRFDKVFSESASQQDVFDYVTPMVDHVLNGLHATVFAYGQTGSGKTFTMDGFNYAPSGQGSSGAPKPRADTPAYQHGVVPRIIQLLFDRARERMGGDTADEADAAAGSTGGDEYGSSMRFKLKCSFMQLYNEKISDLLNPSSTANSKEGLKIRWTRNDQFAVENLYVFECDSPDQMREMFMMGIKEKVMGSHHMNLQSSRSHSLFTIHVHSWDSNAPDLVRKSELTLVDLAGSEKLHLLSQNPTQQLLKESIEINTSLLALGKVITALATNSKQHIPYRDSKLTKLLKHALGGNSVTAMIACCNPLDPYVEETVSTLLYASRARNITNDPRVNENPQSALIRQLREEISSLKMELEYYRQLVATGVVDDGLAKRLANRLEKEQPPIVGVARGGGVESSPEPKQVISSESTRRIGDVGSESQTVVKRSETETELAEKLTESCNILKSLMSVNAQLRTAFDRMKAAKEAVDKRELAVNAENTALRERIEMLESIAMNESAEVRSQASDDDNSANESSVPSTNSKQNGVSALASSNTEAQRRKSQEPTISKPLKQKATNIKAPPQRRLGPYAQKLQDYANKYRNPSKSLAYEDYYQRSGTINAGASKNSGGGANRQRFDTTINTEAEERKSKEVAVLLEKLNSKLPRQTMEMVPKSLQDSSQFGSLAFGGHETDVQQMEDRRKQRQERLARLQAQNANLMSAAPPPLRFQSSEDNMMVMGNSPTPQVRREQPQFNQLLGRAAPATDERIGYGSLNFGGTAGGGGTDRLLRPSSASRAISSNDRSAPLSHQQSNNGVSATSNAERLFAYLSQEEMKGAFTAEQLAKLKSRNDQNNPANPNIPSALSVAALGGSRKGLNGQPSSAPSTPNTGRLSGRPHGQSSMVMNGHVPEPQSMRSQYNQAYGASSKNSTLSASATSNLISRLSGHDKGVPSTQSYSVSTPRSKSSYDMDYRSGMQSNQSSGDRGRGYNLASLGTGNVGGNGISIGGTLPQNGALRTQAPHEAMHRREQQHNEQQRYQQQIYEAQQALLAQQQKFAQQRR